MKKLYIYILSLFVAPSMYSQKTELWIEQQITLREQIFTPILKMNLAHIPKKSIVGFNAFTEVTSKWATVMGGIAIQPKWKKLDVCSFTASFGIESDPTPIRLQCTVLLQKKFFSSTTVFEYGGSGWWVLQIIDFQVHENYLLGIHYEKDVGLGPRFSFTRKPFTAWFVPAYDFESKLVVNTAGCNILF